METAASDTQAAERPADQPARSGWIGRLFAWLVVLALLLAAAVPLGLWWLADTPGGRAFVARQIAGLEPESGLRFEVGRLDGSLLSRFELVDIVVHDLDGPLAVIPRAAVDWEPITLLGRVVSINRLDVPETRMLRMWHINPRDPDAPILPDIDIRLGRFSFDRILLEKPVLGRAEELSAAGRADIDNGRLLLDTQIRSTRNDRLLLLVDAEPDRDRFDLKADLRAPADGALAQAAGLDRAITLQASGAGTWSRWRGGLVAELGDADTAQRVADLALQADNGTFRAKGSLAAAPLLPASLAAMAEPTIDIDATVARPDSLFDIALKAASPALQLAATGRIDASDNRLEAVKLDLLLREPARLNPALAGTGLKATLLADGPLRNPAVRWTADADTLRFASANGQVGVDGLRLSGQLLLPDGNRPLTIPFTATAAGTVGLPPETQALLRNPRASGTLSLANGNLRGQGLKLTTASLTATGDALLQADGRASANFNAGLARVQVPGVGPASVRATVAVARAPGGRPAVNGRFEATMLGLDNASARDFLGGLPTASAGFALAPNGEIAISNGALRSPNLSVVNGRGRYNPATGRFALDAAGKSRAYGPFTLTAAGTSTAPTATLKMPAPGFGFGVTDLVARVAPAPGGLRVEATGESPQGPLDARLVVGVGRGQPLRLDIERAALAGVAASGQLIQTAAGPFAGQLTVDGQGLDASFRFSEQGSLQRIDADARAIHARIPLPTPIGIARGQARFTVLLVPDKPHITGALRASGVSRDGIILTELQGTANLAGTSGVATISAKGRATDGQPFAAASRIQSVPSGYAVSLDGSVGNLPLKLERPAQILRTASGWELRPARLLLPKGQVDASGYWAADRELRLVLRDVDLSILDLLRGGLGFGGKANGQLSIRSDPGAIIPSGDANLVITGLTRPGVTGITIPVDVRLSGSSDDGGLQLGAKLSWQGNDLGRVVVRVDPGPGATPAERFLGGALSGGVRYNGPVEPLWALVGLEGQDLKGAVAIGADFAGTPGDPRLAGIARGKSLIYRNAMFGTEIVDLSFDGQFGGSGLRVNSLSGRANGGTITGSGYVLLGAEPSINLEMELERARLANSDTLEFTLSGPLQLVGKGGTATLGGDLRVDSARIQLVQVETSEVPQLQVRRAGAVAMPQAQPTLTASNLKLDVRVRADDRVRVEGMGLDSIWRGDVRIRGSARQPQLVGVATLARGDFSFAGSDFELASGRVVFNGRPLDSAISIRAQTQAQDVTAVVEIAGTAGKPEIRFSSTPALPEDEILARLLFGSSVADLSVTEAVQLATAIAGLQSGVDTMGKIRRSVGVDRLRLVGDNAETGMGTGIAIGKRLSRNVYVEVLTDSQGNTLTTLQLTLSRIWSLFVEVSSQGQSSVNLRYQREY